MVLNLFNLIPLGPLDGGQIAQAVSEPPMWSVGLHALAVLVFWLPPQALVVVALVVGPLMAARFCMGDAASAVKTSPVLQPGLLAGLPGVAGGGDGGGAAQSLRLTRAAVYGARDARRTVSVKPSVVLGSKPRNIRANISQLGQGRG